MKKWSIRYGNCYQLRKYRHFNKCHILVFDLYRTSILARHTSDTYRTRQIRVTFLFYNFQRRTLHQHAGHLKRSEGTLHLTKIQSFSSSFIYLKPKRHRFCQTLHHLSYHFLSQEQPLRPYRSIFLFPYKNNFGQINIAYEIDKFLKSIKNVLSVKL